MAKKRILRKFTDWEYWPSYMFYLPNIPYLLYLAIKSKSFTFYSAVNPGIKNSGNGTESKFETLKLIPNEYRPESIFVPKKRENSQIIELLKTSSIKYPLIVKPDVGYRGLFVKKIHNKTQLVDYLDNHIFDIIIQEFINLPRECGVFFIKYPNEESGTIRSLTLKSFMKIEGDGKCSVEQLANNNKRAKHYIDRLQKINKDIWQKIPEAGEIIILSEIGNHARGTQFFNGNEFIDKDLENTFNDLSNKISGFYYGRFDIKFNSIEELKKGKNFKFLEVNGVIAEPTHMYDATKGTYFEALRTIREFWKIGYKIANLNHKKGVPYINAKKYWKEIFEVMNYYKEIKTLSERQESA